MSGFDRHNIDHLSASSLNLWINAPDVWVAKYLHGMKSNFGPAPERGKCVESAVVEALHGVDAEQAIANAERKFDRQFLIGDDASMKERALIAPMTMQALAAVSDYGLPEFDDAGDQQKISITANMGDYSIPVIGFLDLVYPQHGLVIDLKTTTRIPSKMSPEHQLQRAFYAKAKGNMAVKFLYVSASKSNLLEDGDPAEVLASAKVQIARLERFLSHHDSDSALACVPHNPSSFYWRGDEAARHQFFGT